MYFNIFLELLICKFNRSNNNVSFLEHFMRNFNQRVVIRIVFLYNCMQYKKMGVYRNGYEFSI